jgi:NADH:ubiquinone oxidoreductase subunit 5 (subunit L)/multisubunit Na+/H+ antiporter MnhA subunit
MYILVVLLPLIGSILSGLCGRYFGREGSAFISTAVMIVTWLIGLFIFVEVGLFSIL